MGYREEALRAKAAQQGQYELSDQDRNTHLLFLADELIRHREGILEENQKDILAAADLSAAMKDRLRLTNERIDGLADSLRQVSAQPGVAGRTLETKTLANGLVIEQVSVGFGLIAMIYESRPNVTVDSFALAYKSGNSVYLRGGKEAVHTNRILVQILRNGLLTLGVNPDMVVLCSDTDRAGVRAMLEMRGVIDLLIPRGSASLINYVVDNARVPILETGAGNCMVYIDETADLSRALEIVDNAKTQRVSVCNSLEKVVIHRSQIKAFVPMLMERFKNRVEVRGDHEVQALSDDIQEAGEDDYGREYLDYIIALKTVGSLDEAIAFINRYHTQHSDAILTENPDHAKQFCQHIDAAVVYVNASTRFSDGAEFGLGAEIGISTQKLHARGPMGLEALTTYKYIVTGHGQIRE